VNITNISGEIFPANIKIEVQDRNVEIRDQNIFYNGKFYTTAILHINSPYALGAIDLYAHAKSFFDSPFSSDMMRNAFSTRRADAALGHLQEGKADGVEVIRITNAFCD
jgi:hypothetical protein